MQWNLKTLPTIQGKRSKYTESKVHIWKAIKQFLQGLFIENVYERLVLKTRSESSRGISSDGTAQPLRSPPVK